MKVPSRAELGHFDFRAETELNRNFFPQVFIIRSPIIQKMWVWCPFKFAIFCNFYSHEPISHKFTFKLFENLKSTLIHYNHRNGILVIFHKVPENWNFSSFLSQFSIPSWSEKGQEPSRAEPSRAENPSAQAMARASSARAHHYYIAFIA